MTASRKSEWRVNVARLRSLYATRPMARLRRGWLFGRLVPTLILAWTPAFAQPVLPERVYTIVHDLYEQNEHLAKGNDTARRALTQQIVEQIVFEFPADGYGWKSASPTRPPSKDCFARQVAERLYCWDWQSGSTRQPLARFLVHDITGQHFIALPGVNHLGVPGPQPAPDPAPDPEPAPSCDLSAVLTQLEALSGEQQAFIDLWLKEQERARQAQEQHAQSLEAHREELRKAKGWFRRIVVEKAMPIVGGLLAGWWAK